MRWRPRRRRSCSPAAGRSSACRSAAPTAGSSAPARAPPTCSRAARCAPAPSPTWPPRPSSATSCRRSTSTATAWSRSTCPRACAPAAARTRACVASDKAIEWIASVDEDVDETERINEILFGAEWHARPRALIVLNTTAPLLISGETARILLRWARLGQPVCMTSCVMGGTTGPATDRRGARRAARRGARHARARAGGPRGLAVRLRRPARDGVAAYRRRPVRRARVLAAGGRDRAAGAPVRPAGPRRRGRHRRPRGGRARDGRVRGGPLGGRVRRRPLPLPGRRHAELVQRAVAREVRPRRRPDHERCARPSIQSAPARTTSPRTSSTRSAPAAATSARRTRAATRATTSAPASRRPSAFERWAAAGGEDAVAAAARRVQELLAAHEPPDDLDAVTRRQLDAYCLAESRPTVQYAGLRRTWRRPSRRQGLPCLASAGGCRPISGTSRIQRCRQGNPGG